MINRSLRIALIGCGQIADAHLQELRRTRGVSVVAVCDQHIDLARQAAARFGIDATFDDTATLLASMSPDVVHITTPPHTHRDLMLQCLAAGTHVYVEKPFTRDTAEAREVIAAAEARRRLVCLGHDQLFDPVWQECLGHVAAGRIGDVVHIESIQGYDLDSPFGKLLTNDPGHWVHKLPGGLFQNVMSHATARILDVMPGPVWVFGRQVSGGVNGAFPTELRATLIGDTCTGSLLFTSAARPVQRVTRVLGTRRGLEVDFDARSITACRAAALPGALAKVELTWARMIEAWKNLTTNVGRFCRSDLHYFEGMHTLFERFYDVVRIGGESPVSHAEAIRVTRVMDAIFESCGSGLPALAELPEPVTPMHQASCGS